MIDQQSTWMDSLATLCVAKVTRRQRTMTLLMVPMTLMLTDHRLEQRRVPSFLLRE